MKNKLEEIRVEIVYGTCFFVFVFTIFSCIFSCDCSKIIQQNDRIIQQNDSIKNELIKLNN